MKVHHAWLSSRGYCPKRVVPDALLGIPYGLRDKELELLPRQIHLDVIPVVAAHHG
jgi:hypothetical protein